MTINRTEFDALTGELTEIPLTAKELKDYENNLVAAELAIQADLEAAAAKVAAKQAVLDKLGLSAEEVAALLG